jgi:TRAP transporter TAXI family solute receptor
MRPSRLKSLIKSFFQNWYLIALAAAFCGMAFYLWHLETRPRQYSLRISGGDSLGRRHQLAQFLAKEADAYHLKITVVPTSGSLETFEKVVNGELEIALIQGGQDAAPGIAQVAALHIEPLHVLVKKESASGGLAGLIGKRISLSTPGSGTRRLATQVLKFARLEPGKNFSEQNCSYTQLKTLPYAQLPDAVCLVSTMPAPVADYLVDQYGYKFIPLPFGQALSLRDATIVPSVIPAYAYGASPASPASDIATVGNHLLLIARRDTPAEAIQLLLTALFQSSFQREADIPPLDENKLAIGPEMPLHPGTTAYMSRDTTIFTSDFLQGVDSLRNTLASLAIALFFLIRWWIRRRYTGFEEYITEIAHIEEQALALEMEPELHLAELLKLRARLTQLKSEALTKFAKAELNSEEMMSGFLTHVADVRNFIATLILSERNRIATRSADSIPDELQDERFRAQWKEAVEKPAQQPKAS